MPHNFFRQKDRRLIDMMIILSMLLVACGDKEEDSAPEETEEVAEQVEDEATEPEEPSPKE